MADEFSVRVTKSISRLVSHELTAYLSVFDLFLTQWIMTILSKGCKPYTFESNNSLKFSFTNIWGLCSNFVDSYYFLELNSPDILALCETNLDDSGNFSVRDYLPLIQKDSTTHINGLVVKEGLPFAQDLPPENSADSDLCVQLALLDWVFSWLSVLLLFPLSITFFIFMHDFLFYFI